MSMIFCHGCGKSIHNSAPTCPQCGALQGAAQKQLATTSVRGSSSATPWMGIVSMVLGALALFAGLEDSSLEDKEVVLGMAIFASVGLITGVIGTAKGESPKGLSIAGLIVSIIMLLVCIGTMAK